MKAYRHAWPEWWRSLNQHRHLLVGPSVSAILTIASPQEHLLPLSFVPSSQEERTLIMKLATIGLAAVMALTSTFALAQSSAGSAGGGAASPGATGTTSGSSTTGSSVGTTGGTSNGLSNNAGSAAAGANSTVNPSGNSYINPSPSGSTVGPAGAGSGVGR
jgi:hypothetical protein